MTQSYRGQLRHHLRQAHENVMLCRANLLDDIDALQNRKTLHFCEAELRHVKHQFAQSRRYLSCPPVVA